jgi:RNA polymerase sigma-70 factor (ECF subfamily)
MESKLVARSEIKPKLEGEARVVEAARNDQAAFTLLYRRYVTPIYRYLYKWTGDQAEAEDLTSQVFLEALQGLDRYREQGSFAAWLFTIARRKAISAYHRQLRSLPIEEAEEIPEPGADPLERAVQDEQRERMAVLFAELEEEQRELLYLRFTAGLNFAEIGALFGRNEAAVKMAIYRLLRLIHARWDEK